MRSVEMPSWLAPLNCGQSDAAPQSGRSNATITGTAPACADLCLGASAAISNHDHDPSFDGYGKTVFARNEDGREDFTILVLICTTHHIHGGRRASCRN